MQPAESNPATIQDQGGIALSDLVTTLQPQVNAFLKNIYRSCSSLFSNQAPANEIDIYDAIDIAVRRKRNSRATINRLSTDIIHCIFAEALDLERIHDVDFPIKSVEAHRKQLFQLRGVSSAWSEFLLASSRYWSAVNIGVSPALIERALERAQKTPLCLYTLQPSRAVIKMLTLTDKTSLQSRVSQVRSIRASDARAATLCKSLFCSYMPLLESLELPFSKLGADFTQYIQPYVQNLRQIKAAGSWPDVETPKLHNLRTLNLSGWTIGPGTTHLLAACVNLLTLSITLVTRSGAWERGKPPITFALPNLQELTVEFGWPAQCHLIQRLVTPFNVRGALRFRYTGIDGPDAEVIADICQFILPDAVTPPILDAAVVSIYGHKNSPHWSQFARITYSAGARLVDLGIAGSSYEEGQCTVAIKALQARLNNPPLEIMVIDYSTEDTVLRRFANLGVRRIWIKFAKDMNAVLTSIGGGGPTLPSGTPHDTEWPFESVQELIIEQSRLSVKQLTRVVGVRQQHLRANSKSWLKRILLVNCHLIGMTFEKAAKELAALGVTLVGTGCNYSQHT